MRKTLDRFLDSSTPASRCIFAILAATPFFGVFWAESWAALLHPDIGPGVNAGAVQVMLAIFTLGIVINISLGGWLWLRRQLPDRVPRASLTVALTIGLSYASLMIASGAYTSGANMILLGVLAIGLLLFDRRTMLTAFLVCAALHVAYDTLVLDGLAQYAPAITPHAFEDGRPVWWWAVWRDSVFYVGWAIILTLVFLLFGRLDALHQQLSKLSHTDVLTGLANRRYFTERLEAEMRRFQRTGIPYSVLLLDVDHFKSINDRFGHQAGDEVLCRLAHILTEGVRTPIDQSARIGGEEFAVLLPDTSIEAAEVVCRRIAAGLKAHEFDMNGHRFHLTVSMGVVECRGEPMESVLQAADRLLYTAKQQGRNQAVYGLAGKGA